MGPSSMLPLDDDIVDRIMTFCPTFGTLQAMVSASKAFHRVFQAHPKSITRAVAFNIVGPALPQALRVVRYPYLKQHDKEEQHPSDESARLHDEYASSDDEENHPVLPDVLDPIVVPFNIEDAVPNESESSDTDEDDWEDEDEDDMHDFSEDDDSSVESNWADADSDAAELVDPVTMATACPESDLPTLLTTKQQNELETLAKDVAELEDIYSITTKDHTSKTSVLTPGESLRFRRAMYRITLYTKLFSLKQYTLDEIENLSVGTRRTVRQQRTAVLNEYPTNELLEIVSVVNFLRGIFNAVADPDLVDMLLATGPRGALQTWKSRSYYGLQDDYDPDLFFTADVEIPFYARYFTRAFDAIWGARDVEPPRRHDGADKWILDSVTGKDDTCSQCDDPRGLKLFTQANWSRFPVTSPLDHLKNQLRDNPTVSGPFARMWHKNDRSLSDSDDLGTWIAGLFEMRVAARAVGTGTKSTSVKGVRTSANAASESVSTNGVSTSTSTASTLALAPKTLATLKHGSFATFDGWDVGLSYCWPCLHLFIQAHAWVWWLEEQLKLGWTPPEDCRYGYNCKTQRREDHAQSENHLCVPSMVNPYGVRGHKS